MIDVELTASERDLVLGALKNYHSGHPAAPRPCRGLATAMGSAPRRRSPRLSLWLRPWPR